MATKTELYEEAGKLGIEGRDKMTRTELSSAIKKAKAKPNPIEQPTPNQVTEARGKEPTELAEQAATAETPQERNAAEIALEEKASKAAAEQEKARLRRPKTQKYVVTKRCLISNRGILADIAEGSVVSNRTHNLDAIRAAGGELKAVKDAKVVRDQFRTAVTVVEE